MSEYYLRDIKQEKEIEYRKGTFFSESTVAFVRTPKTLTFFFSETENLNFGDF